MGIKEIAQSQLDREKSKQSMLEEAVHSRFLYSLRPVQMFDQGVIILLQML